MTINRETESLPVFTLLKQGGEGPRGDKCQVFVSAPLTFSVVKLEDFLLPNCPSCSI